MRKLCIFLLLTGCASMSEDGDIRLYHDFPDCRFEPLGPVEGRDGYSNDLTTTIQGKRGSSKVAVRRLKDAAIDLGADAVVVVSREIRQPPVIDHSRVRKPARMIILIGMAIRDCAG